ncbi:MAG: hypothetical protein Q9157_004783 [Trypethelium eluteriae]
MAMLSPMPSFSDFDGTHYAAADQPEDVISPVEPKDLERSVTTDSETGPEQDQQEASSSIVETPPGYEGYPRPRSDNVPLLPHAAENSQLLQELAQAGPTRESLMCDDANDAALMRQAILPRARYSQTTKPANPAQVNARATSVSQQEADSSSLYADEGQYSYMLQDPHDQSSYLEKETMLPGRDKPERMSNEGQDDPRQPLPEAQDDLDRPALEDLSARKSLESPSNEGQRYHERSSDWVPETVQVERTSSKATKKEFDHPTVKLSVQMSDDSSEAIVACQTTESQERIASNGTAKSIFGSPTPPVETQSGDVQTHVDSSSLEPQARSAETPLQNSEPPESLHDISIRRWIEQTAKESSNATACEDSPSQSAAQATSTAPDRSSALPRTADVNSAERPSSGPSESATVVRNTSAMQSPRVAQEITREQTTRAPSPSAGAPPSQRRDGEMPNQGRKRSSSETIRGVQVPGRPYAVVGQGSTQATAAGRSARNSRLGWAQRLAHPFGGAGGGSNQEGGGASQGNTGDEGPDTLSCCQRFFSCISGPFKACLGCLPHFGDGFLWCIDKAHRLVDPEVWAAIREEWSPMA